MLGSPIRITTLTLACAAAAASLSAGTVRANSAGEDGIGVGVGFQHIVHNAWGPSLLVRLRHGFELQGLYGLVYTRDGEKDLMVRLRGTALSREDFGLYGYGGWGAMQLDSISGNYYVQETGSVFSTGGGIAYRPRSVRTLSLEAEAGVEFVRGFQVVNGNYTSFIASLGLHLRF